MKVATWNVNGMRARQLQFMDWVQVERPDVICLQEIKAAQHQLVPDLLELPGYVSCWHCAGPYSGVSLNLRADTFPEPPAFSHPRFDRECRIVQAQLGQLVLASVYVPNGRKDFDDKLAFLADMRAWVAEIRDAGQELVVCGDMNVTRADRDVHPKERNPKFVGQRPEERQVFELLLDQGLADLGRDLHPDDSGYFTWWAPWREHRQRNIGWRLDYVLASSGLAQRASECMVQRETGTSDHGPVIATFEGVP
jgi:exodeoxyribonuclease-3